MPTPITIPRLGWFMDEGTFVGWLKQDGESVQAGEPLFTLEGDKAAQEVEALESGVLRIPPDAPKAGDAVSVGALLGYLVSESEAALPEAPLSPPLSPSDGERGAPPGEGGGSVAAARLKEQPVASAGGPPIRVAASPRARRCAAELGLDYRPLKGSGRTGRIVEADVLAAAKQIVPASSLGMRRTIAQRTAESFARAPHFYLHAEVDAGPLLRLRERLLPGIEQATGVRLTLTDLLLRAQALALRDHPEANAIWREDRVVRFSACDLGLVVGLVVGLADGLLVPIVRAADAGDLAALVRQRAALVEAARAGQLTAEQMQGGATSLSNLGNTRVDEFTAVIAPPQSSMLAVGRAAPRPVVVEGQLVIRTTLKLCLSVDHRVMDGAPAAKFLGRIVERLEQPLTLTMQENRG